MARAIEAAGGVPLTRLGRNTNLMGETTRRHLADGSSHGANGGHLEYPVALSPWRGARRRAPRRVGLLPVLPISRLVFPPVAAPGRGRSPEGTIRVFPCALPPFQVVAPRGASPSPRVTGRRGGLTVARISRPRACKGMRTVASSVPAGCPGAWRGFNAKGIGGGGRQAEALSGLPIVLHRVPGRCHRMHVTALLYHYFAY